MSADRDLSALLPETPPPRPARRDAAIAEALRLFDGAPQTPPARTTLPAARPSLFRRPLPRVLLAASLVAVVALPVWMVGDRDAVIPARPPVATSDVTPAPAAPSAQAASAAPDTASPAPVASAPAEAAPPAAETPAVAAPQAQADAAQAPAMESFAVGEAAPAPPPPPPPAPVVAMASPRMAAPGAKARAAPADDIVVTAQRRQESLQDVPFSVTAYSQEKLGRARAVQARSSGKRGDWNACTVDDPARRAATCGLGSGRLADGLARAWQGDLDGAIADFDAAIAAAPQGSAYLNRGLAYARKGDRTRALADLDRAVRADPNSARAYYHRSLLLRRSGAKDRAEADAERAVELDERYREVIR